MGLLIVLILVVLVVLIAGWLAMSYNRFVRQRNVVQESWRQVDVELQRRHDLIPNLVETVKAFAAQEQNVLVSVIEARNRAEAVRQSPGIHAAEQAQAEGQLQRAVGGLFAVAEAYPDLKSNQNFLGLQQQLAETEDRVAAGRRYYNANVRELNTRVEAFPSNLIAGAFKFGKEEYFEVDDPASRAAVQVDFSGLGQVPQRPAAPQQPGAAPGIQGGQQPGQLPPPQV
ncbi:MAG: LemA protein [Cryptosporangiaceae bacterium]|nr:LemA protein [Cryptosporangiaceae bacterium]